ncbi:ribonuclease H-like domain-containing protein [Tanacetum coccineum]
MAIGEPSGPAVSINGLDAGNSLHVQNTRNIYGFVDGTCLKESYAFSNVLSAKWDRCNAMVLNWIMNVESQDVYMGLVYSENAVTVWKEFNETYDKVDSYIVYKLLQKINSIKQGSSSVADYYHRSAKASYPDLNEHSLHLKMILKKVNIKLVSL